MGGVRGYFLISTAIAAFVVWVACTVIFNYYQYCEFCCCSGGVRGYFLITTMFTNFVSRVACAAMFELLLLLRALFPGWPARLFF